ncbi:hypothetical protein V8E55_007542 [Tylopilus felleus]
MGAMSSSGALSVSALYLLLLSPNRALIDVVHVSACHSNCTHTTNPRRRSEITSLDGVWIAGLNFVDQLKRRTLPIHLINRWPTATVILEQCRPSRAQSRLAICQTQNDGCCISTRGSNLESKLKKAKI